MAAAGYRRLALANGSYGQQPAQLSARQPHSLAQPLCGAQWVQLSAELVQAMLVMVPEQGLIATRLIK
ncbi:hypothetical protein D9M71_781250 [compost metagenome]